MRLFHSFVRRAAGNILEKSRPDPTTLNRQGPDADTQYRSEVFFHDADQKKVAKAVKDSFFKALVGKR
jgi:peptide methionine sulfoxide reductase MsrA